MQPFRELNLWVTDDSPQFDKEGNPNFDTQGNYQGCRGIGCEVDMPEDDGSSDDADSD
jgi:hypothetical protein